MSHSSISYAKLWFFKSSNTSIINPKSLSLKHAPHKYLFINNFLMTEAHDHSEFTIFSNLNWTPRKFIFAACNCLKWSWAALWVTIFLQDCSSQLHFALYNNHPNFWPSQLFLEDTLSDGWWIYTPGELKQSLPPVILTSLQKQGWLNSLKISSWTATLQLNTFMEANINFILSTFMY